MHTAIINRFPRLGTLWSRSNRTRSDNYFAIYNSPALSPGTEKQFVTWESLLQCLDSESFEIFLRKAAGRVCACSIPERGWSQLIDCMNEVRGYQYAQSLGYSAARLLNEQSFSLPDIEAAGLGARGLIEVKTIQESDLELTLREQVQSEETGLPWRLERAIKTAYSKAKKQIAAHPWAGDARKICYLFVNLDLRTLLAVENKVLLERFLDDLQDEVEIHCTSQYWPANQSAA